ncbi:MAG TPA: hypothetical protein VF954_03745 [Acidimicrobiales bacterium]
MGRGALSRRRWKNDRVKRKKGRDLRAAVVRGEARKAEGAAAAAPA